MKKAIIIILILLIIGLVIGLFVILKSSKNPSDQTNINLNPSAKVTPDKTTTISLTKNGFEPKDITISPNTKVVWTNNSGQLATIDSNPHPIHTDHSELNLGEFAGGDSLDLIFTKTGEFKYHNHYNPDEGGTITVQ